MAATNTDKKPTPPLPSDWLRSTRHELITQDASYQLLKASDELRDLIIKTHFEDDEEIARTVQCLNKLQRYRIGEGCEPEYTSGIDMVKNWLASKPAKKGRARSDFMQGLARVYAPGSQELKETGKISAENAKPKKHLGILKSREEKQEEQPQ